MWDLPKGKQEAYETPKQAALREVKEECGLKKLKIINKLIPTFHMYLLNKGWVIKKTNWYEMLCKDNQTPVPQAEEDIKEARWFNEADLAPIISNTHKSLQELLNVYLNNLIRS